MVDKFGLNKQGEIREVPFSFPFRYYKNIDLLFFINLYLNL